MRIERFEDLIAWQKARELTREIYCLTRNSPFANDHGLTNQIRRAAVSVMSNIAEGFERWGNGEFEHFLSIAKASCAEVRSQLYVALDVGYLEHVVFERLLNETQEIARILGGLRTSVKKQRKPKSARNADPAQS
ncbi:four helix bundle protein [bacterium]|nr:four helix bundle protein [bacterium]